MNIVAQLDEWVDTAVFHQNFTQDKVAFETNKSGINVSDVLYEGEHKAWYWCCIFI